MKYQIVKKNSGQGALVLGFISDQAPTHLQPYQLEMVLENALKPQHKQTSIWCTYQQQPTLLVNFGKQTDLNRETYAQSIKHIAEQLKAIKAQQATLCLPILETACQGVQLAVTTLEEALYTYSIKKPTLENEAHLTTINLLSDTDDNALQETLVLAKAVKFTRDLGNMPANHCTPDYLAQAAIELASQSTYMNASVLGEAEMAQLGMQTILAVSRGSQQEAKFIELHYQNGGEQAPVVLVGKGITFDAGGLSLKPADAMTEMKFDMCGAATVLGVMKAVSELQLPLNVIGLIAASENLPGPNAVKPGDIISSYSKQTIEILNTDAEGRLLLCDALSYAEKFKPAKVVDIATLTGAIIVALGYKTNGLMGNNQSLCDELLAAGQKANDKAWQLPLWEEYQSLIDSNIADIANIGSDRSAGSITAGCFLARFTKNYPWAHIDCAGTAWQTGKNKTATGRPVPLLVQFLKDQCQ